MADLRNWCGKNLLDVGHSAIGAVFWWDLHWWCSLERSQWASLRPFLDGNFSNLVNRTGISKNMYIYILYILNLDQLILIRCIVSTISSCQLIISWSNLFQLQMSMVKKKRYWGLVTVVPQQPVLFSGASFVICMRGFWRKKTSPLWWIPWRNFTLEPGPSESVLRAEIVGLDQGTMFGKESKQQESYSIRWPSEIFVYIEIVNRL